MEDGLKKVAIVAFSYALREEEPNPCNIRIAKIVEQVFLELRKEGYKVYVVAQWEVALQLEVDGFHVDHVVHARSTYLSSDDVFEEAQEYVLDPEDIDDVIPVAHRWLQIVKVKQLIKGSGRRVVKRYKGKGKIGFDKSPLNLQPWTKGSMRALVHAIRKQFFGHHHPTY